MPQFLAHAVGFNRVHNPDDELHEALLRPAATGLAEPAPGSLEARAAAARKALAAIHRDFPGGAPLWEQAAYLVRGFAGLQPFKASDFEAGWDYTTEALARGGHELRGPEADAAGFVGNRLWTLLREAYPKGFTRKDLLERDEVLEELARWFKSNLASRGAGARVPPA